MPAVLRVGHVAGAAAACAAPARNDESAMARYAAFLAGRLNLSVELCAFPDDASLAAAFAQNAVDFGQLTVTDFAAANGQARPILRVRPQKGLARTTVVAVTRKDAQLAGPAAIAASRVGVIGPGPLLHDAPRATLAAAGGPAVLDREPSPVGVGSAALAALQSGAVDALLLPASYWSVTCSEAGDACADFDIAWQGLPPLERAWSLRNDAPRELRYRLIGMHVPLHLENPTLFAAIAGADGAEFEPTEAAALSRPAGGQ
jgi:ABC-type phosphate/phosphonate transport system substrate-binding protein